MTYRDVERYYEELRRAAKAKRDYYHSLAERIPAFSQAEKEEKSAFMALYRAEYEGSEEVERLRAAAQEKREKTENLLRGAGIDPALLTLQYTCEKCKDTGFVESRPCSCYTEVRKKVLLSSGVTASFPTLSVEKIASLTEVSALQKHTAAVARYAKSFPKTKAKTLVFSGKCGTGKTHLMQGFCKDVETSGYSVCYHTALELNQLFLDYHTAKNGTRADIMDRLLLSDLLAIDDLGTEPILKNVTVEYLLSVISTRALRGKHTVITTNLGGGDLLTRYGERLFSRLADKATACWLIFKEIPDLRLVNR